MPKRVLFLCLPGMVSGVPLAYPMEKPYPCPQTAKKGLSEKACDFSPQISKRTFAYLNICLQSRRLFFFILLQFRQFLFEIVYLFLLFLKFFHPVHLQQRNGIENLYHDLSRIS